MSKLFEIPAEPIKRTFHITTYKGNRIILKLLKLLAISKIYEIKKSKNTCDLLIFEISILSKKDLTTETLGLISEIISLIPDNFPPNYTFRVNSYALGYVNSFEIDNGEYKAQFSHKIKEINKNSIMPKQQIFYTK